MQGLEALPEELVKKVLRATDSHTSLLEQLSLLPSAFHAAAIHAAFPSIEADRSVCVDASDLEHAPFAEALWPAISNITVFGMQVHGAGAVGNHMPPHTAAALGCQLVKLSCLQKLGLSGNRIGAAVAASLGPHLAHLKSIQVLALSSNLIGDEGAISLGPHLAHLTSIQHLTCMQRLDLSGNRIRANGVKSLGPHLAHLTSIQQLNLSGSRIGPDGAEFLGPYLAKLTCMQRLNLGLNGLHGSSAAKALASRLAHITSLDLILNDL